MLERNPVAGALRGSLNQEAFGFTSAAIWDDAGTSERGREIGAIWRR